jgi:ketosteroid isomerase-like protein
MSQENVEVVREMCESFVAGQIERALELLDEDVEWRGTVGGLDEGRIYRGHKEVIAAFMETYEAWDQHSLDPTDFIDAGDQVVVFWHEVGRGKESGALVETDTGVIYTVKDGSVVLVRGFIDRSKALEAAGLSD